MRTVPAEARRRSPLGALRAVVLVGVVLCALGCSSDGDGSSASTDPSPDATSVPADTPSDVAASTPALTPGSTPGSTPGTVDGPGSTAADGTVPDGTAAGAQPQGFTTIEARITAADGEVCEVCLWLADSEEERGRGLMGVTDLGDAGGMAFVFDPPTTGAFYMFQTPTPLSIAWYGDDGAWVGSAEMEPCLDASPQNCTLYSPGGAAYTVGVETFEGGLEPLLLVEGSTIELIAGTENLECQTPSS